MHYILGAAVGFVAGAFCPSILRKIKALFVAESKKAEGYVSAEVVKEVHKL